MVSQRPINTFSALAATSTAYRCSSGPALSTVRSYNQCHSVSQPCLLHQSYSSTPLRNSSRRTFPHSSMHRAGHCMHGIPMLLFIVGIFAATSAFVTTNFSRASTRTPAPAIDKTIEGANHNNAVHIAVPSPPMFRTTASRDFVQNTVISATRNRLDWDDSDLPSFCTDIMAYPQPLRKNCPNAEPVSGTPKCDPSRPMMYSQYGEDYFLYTRHFQHLQRPGTYLDIATNKYVYTDS